MAKLLFIFSAFLCLNIYGQETDSVYIRTTPIIADSLSGPSDTLGVITDTTLIAETDTVKTKIDSLIPIYRQTLLDSLTYSNAYSRGFIEMSEYRNAADWFNYFPNAYYRDPGYLGQPGEVLLYGAGWGETSYYADGFQLNNRYNNSYNLNEFLSESADSVEISPLPRGFLYGTANNSTAVNFITKDFISKEPYSRLRFYQGPNEEGFIDAQFNARIHKKFNLYAEIENNAVDEFLDNTWFGQWKAAVKLKYYQSNALNIIGQYNYLKSNTRLFGGIDSEALLDQNLIISNDLQSAPIKYPLRYVKNAAHNFALSFLIKHAAFLNGDLSAYYMTRIAEHRNNDRDTLIERRIMKDNEYYTWGLKLKERLASGFFYADVQASYENTEFKLTSIDTTKENTSSLALAGTAGINLLNNSFHPAVFGKVLQTNDETYIGLGADITADITKRFRLYAGASFFQKPLDEYERISSGLDFSPADRENLHLQAGGSFSSDYFSAGAAVYMRNIKNNLMPVFRNDTLFSYSVIQEEAITGANINFKFQLWRLFIETSANLYNSDFSGSFLPDYNGSGSIYYRDILFNKALDLKTGFNAVFSLGQKYFYYNYESGRGANLTMTNSSSIERVTETEYMYFDKNAFKLDLFIIGRIQERAILYFIYENLLNENIFVVPEYPLQLGGIRLGFAWEFYN